MPRSSSRLIAAAILLTACGDPAGPGDVTSVRQVGGITADTINGFADPIIVEVGDSAGGLANANVSISTTMLPYPACPTCPPYPFAFLVDSVSAFNDTGTVRTDARARLTVRLHVNGRAGVGYLRVHVPSRGIADSIALTVQPGNAVGVRGAPHDTLMRNATSFTLRGAVIDRSGNARPEPVTYTALSAGVTVGAAASSRAVRFPPHKSK